LELFEITQFSLSGGTATVTIDKKSPKGQVGTSQLVTIQLEPTSTASALAIIANIAKAILDNQSLKSQFDQLGDRFESIVRQAVEEIKAHISKVIDDNEVRKLQASLDAVKRHLIEYELSASKPKYRLEAADIASTDAYYLCERIGLIAIFPYITATSLKLATHLVIYKAMQDKGELDISRNLISETIPKVQDLANQAVEFWNTRIASVTPIESWTKHHPCHRCNIECLPDETIGRFYDHSAQAQYVDQLHIVEKKRNEILNHYNVKKQETIDNILTPTSIAISRWMSVLEDGDNAILRIEC
jgi:hypothetical protein